MRNLTICYSLLIMYSFTKMVQHFLEFWMHHWFLCRVMQLNCLGLILSKGVCIIVFTSERGEDWEKKGYERKMKKRTRDPNRSISFWEAEEDEEGERKRERDRQTDRQTESMRWRISLSWLLSRASSIAIESNLFRHDVESERASNEWIARFNAQIQWWILYKMTLWTFKHVPSSQVYMHKWKQNRFKLKWEVQTMST